MIFFKSQIKQNSLAYSDSLASSILSSRLDQELPGFMIIEVIIAVALLGIGSIAIMNLQINTLGRMRQTQVHLDHIFKLQNLFFNPEIPKNILPDDMPMHTFETKDIIDFKPVSKKSDLNRFKDIYLMQATGSWIGFNRDYEDSMVGLVYIAPKQPENLVDQKENQLQNRQEVELEKVA